MQTVQATADAVVVNYLQTNGPREVARRQRQIANGQLPFYHKTPKSKPKIVIRREGKMVTLLKDVK